MAGPIATLRVLLSADDAKLRKALGSSDKATRKWAQAQKRRNAAVAKTFTNVAAAAVGVGAAVGAMSVKAIKATDELAKQAKTIGITVEKLQQYTFAAERSGVSTSEMVKGLQQFNKFVGQAARGTGTAKKAFQDLGISLRDGNGNLRTQDALIREFVETLSTIENPMMRAGLASDVFGRAGVKLLPMMAGGAEGMDQLMKAASDLGTVMDNETAAKAEILNDKLDTLSEAIKTSMYTSLVNMVDQNQQAFAKLIDITQAAVTAVSGILRGVQASILLFESFWARGMGNAAKFVMDFASSITSFASTLKLRLELAAVNMQIGVRKIMQSATKAAEAGKKLAPEWVRSFLGWDQGASSTGTDPMLANLEARANGLRQGIKAITDAGASASDSPLVKFLLGMADELEADAFEAGAKGGAAFAEAFRIATEGGMGTRVSEGIDALGPAADPASIGSGEEAVEDANQKIISEQLTQMQNEKKLVDVRRNTMQQTLGFLQQQVKGSGAAGKALMAGMTALNIAQILSNTEVAKMRALAEMGPIAGPPMAAAIQAQGMVSAGIAAAQGISGMFHDGIDNVPNTGTFLLEKGERVVDRRLNEDLTKALAEGGSGVGGGSNTFSINVNGVSDAETINRVISEQRPQFEQMLRDINSDNAGQGLL